MLNRFHFIAVTFSLFSVLCPGFTHEYEKLRYTDFGVGDEYLTRCMYEARENVNRAIHRTQMHWKKDEIWADPMQLFQFFKRPPGEEAEQIARAADIFETAVNYVNDKVTQRYQREKRASREKRRINATDVLSSETLQQLAKFAGCLPNKEILSCPDNCHTRKFRTITGKCNNPSHTYWGASNNKLVRWLPGQYENDFNHPMGWDADMERNGFKLPFVRKVSNDIMHTSNKNVTDDDLYSHMLVVWGQYIDHDFDLTPQSLSTSTFQGLTNCKETCKNEPPCFPIMVPEDDQRVRDIKCLPFFRSAAVCGSGETSGFFSKLVPREQINAVTSFVDASTVYGSTEEMAKSLRDWTTDEGLMLINDRYKDNDREYLPFNMGSKCVQDPSDASGEEIPCFLAGDTRVSEHLTLSAIHTLWVREHNRIAKQLKILNPHWNGERIYQETRKIIGSLHQIVQYKEYIPKIIGQRGMDKMGEYEAYDPNYNPSISNVFATAAFRFGHVTIAPMFRRLNDQFQEHEQFKNILLHQAFFSPWRIIKEGGLDPIFRGLIGKPAKLATPDEIMHEELREKLFQLQNKIALDLASLNLQRGRDHALPLYNEWRKFCNLSEANTFEEVAGEISNPDVRRKLEEIYGHPGNMDLWLAGLVEDIIEGTRVGPTFLCLLTKQFHYQRDGDRFYYRNDVHTDDQLEALEKIRLSNVLCANSGLNMVQRDVFALADFPDDFMRCEEMEMLDLEPWREAPEVGSCGRPDDTEYGVWDICGDTVVYSCMEGYASAASDGLERRCLSSGTFDDDPPTCTDMNECEQGKDDCEKKCVNTRGSFRCECDENEILNEDGKTCSLAPPNTENGDDSPNVPAIITGVILGLGIVAVLVASSFGIYKYMKLRIAMQAEKSPKYRLTDGVNGETIHNPNVIHVDPPTDKIQ